MDYSYEEKWDRRTRDAIRFEFTEPDKTDFLEDYVDWAVKRWMNGIISLSNVNAVDTITMKKMAKADKKDQLHIKKNVAKAEPPSSQNKQKANG